MAMKRPQTLLSLGRSLAIILIPLLAPPVARSQTAVQPPAGFPAMGQPARVTLVSPGANPRTALRFVVPRDYTGRMKMDMTMSMTMGMLGQSLPMDLPVMHVGADVTVMDVAASGDVTFRMAFTGIEVDGATPDAAFTALNNDFKTITGVFVVSNRGITKQGRLDASKVNDPQFVQTLDSLTTSLNGLSMPFPEEAVGLGARWEARQVIASGGVTMFQKVDCELTAFDGKSATL